MKKGGVMEKLVNGILLSFAIMGLFIGLQVMISTAALMGAAVGYAVIADCDMQYAMNQSAWIAGRGNFMIWLTVAATAVSAGYSAISYWVIWGRKKPEQDKYFFIEKVLRPKTILMVSISALGLYFVAVLIAELIAVVSPETMESYNELMEMTLGSDALLAMLAAVILAPINEECIMRGLILRNLQKYFPIPVVIVIQAVMFGIFHMNWVQGLYVLPIGAALGYVAVKSRSIFPCIYMHLFYNLMSFVVGLLPEACQSVVFCVAAAAVSAVVVWLLGRESYGKSKVNR